MLKLWIDNDMENIFRIKCGNHHFQAPYEYETNSADVIGGISEFGGPFSQQSVQRARAVLKELLGHIAKHHYKNNDLVSAAIYATALRRLSPDSNQVISTLMICFAYGPEYSLRHESTDLCLSSRRYTATNAH